jgi:hypothetical protein
VQEDVSISLSCAFGFAPLSCYLYITVIYDAGVLVFGIAAIPLLWQTQRSHTTVLAVLLAPFMLPPPAILATH